jgi:hypothetical protein
MNHLAIKLISNSLFFNMNENTPRLPQGISIGDSGLIFVASFINVCFKNTT